jgi:hypothetical protein
MSHPNKSLKEFSMNSSVRLALAAAIAMSSMLIATMAQVHAQSIPAIKSLRNKIDVLRPSPGKLNTTQQDRFRLFDQFRDDKPGWIEVKRAPSKDDRVNPVIPSAGKTLRNLNH